MIDDDFKNIIETITLYFKGTYFSDVDMLYEAFHKDARITGLINNEYYDWSLKDFISRITNKPSASNSGEKYDKEIISIDITKNAASVKSRVVVAGLIFYDYILLLKINNNWLIRNKSFSNVEAA